MDDMLPSPHTPSVPTDDMLPSPHTPSVPMDDMLPSPHTPSVPTDDMLPSPHTPSVPTDDTREMIVEMAALGLPSSFIARLQGTSKKSRKKSTSCYTTSCSGTTNKHDRSTKVIEVADEDFGSAIFCVRSVRLYTPTDLTTAHVEEGVLDRTIELQQEIPSIDDNAKNRPHFKFETSQTSDGVDVLRHEENIGADPVEVNGGTRWEPVWDELYQCYYFCNTQTWESTWEPPPGFEKSTPSSLAIDDNSLGAVSSFVTAQDVPLDVVNDEGIIHKMGSDSGLKVCSTLTLAEKLGGEEGPLSSLEQGKLSVEYKEMTTLKRTCGVEEGDCDELVSPQLAHPSDPKKQSSSEEVDYLPAIPISQIRFRDSEESSSSNEVGGLGGIDWEAIKVERSTQHIRGDAGEEGSPSSQYWPSYSHAEVIQHPRSWKGGVKKRWLRSLSGADELDKVLLPGMVEMMSKNLVKYWLQRYTLFAKYDKGVKMDDEGWFSVTPEAIAKHQASRCATGLLIDAFTGVGGNAIQFALTSHHVIAIDINPVRIEYARHNAEVYGVAHKIEFIVGDFFQLAPILKADVVFLSPPWGGPEYLTEEIYDLQTMLQPKDGCSLFKVAQSVAPNIALFVPRNVDYNQLQELSWLTSPPLPCEVEENFVNDKLKAVTAYYGEIAVQNLCR